MEFINFSPPIRVMAPLQELVSKNALGLYAGALLGFYGGRLLHAVIITPLVERIFTVEEGAARTGLQNPTNWAEIVDIAWGALGVAFLPNVTMRASWLAGSFISLTDHLLARYPDVAESIPGA